MRFSIAGRGPSKTALPAKTHRRLSPCTSIREPNRSAPIDSIFLLDVFARSTENPHYEQCAARPERPARSAGPRRLRAEHGALLRSCNRADALRRDFPCPRMGPHRKKGRPQDRPTSKSSRGADRAGCLARQKEETRLRRSFRLTSHSSVRSRTPFVVPD